MTDCAKCGACLTVCPVYQATGREPLTARGKLHLFEHLTSKEQTAEYANILSACLLCGACDDVCPRQVDIHHLVLEARQKLPTRSSKQTLLYKISQKALAAPSLLSDLSKTAQAAANLFLKKLPEKSAAISDTLFIPSSVPALKPLQFLTCSSDRKRFMVLHE